MQLPKMLVAMWRLGFFFHEIAFGLLSVFIPLYVVSSTFHGSIGILGGPLLAVGIMTSVALFCAIPSSFLWGFLCDTTRHYKAFILLSFSSTAIILFLMTMPFAKNIVLFVVLYVIMQVLHVAHEAPKNILIAEHYSREDWEKSFGFYEGLTEIGFIGGLAVGIFAFVYSMSASWVLYLCSGLSVVALVMAIALIADPVMIFERRLVGIEKRIDFTYRGLESSSKMMDGFAYDGALKQDNFSGFAVAIVMFSLATSLFFTPLPMYLKSVFNGQTSMVYVAYILNSVGATVGYFLIRGRARSMNIRKQMPRFILYRGCLIFLLVGFIELAVFPNIMTGLFLLCLGFVYAMYYIMMLSLSMELIPEGKAGLFDGLVGVGAAFGAFLGPFLAEMINYVPMFIIAAVIFIIAFVAIKLS
jgi:MFS family permease